MKNKFNLTIISILISAILVIPIMALDYSITGDKYSNTSNSIEKVSFDAWHGNGRASVYNPKTNKWSKGLSPQGKGTLLYSYEYKNSSGTDYRRTINLNLDETSIVNYGDWIKSVNLASGTIWNIGNKPIRLENVSFVYRYNINTKEVFIESPYLNRELVVKNK